VPVAPKNCFTAFARALQGSADLIKRHCAEFCKKFLRRKQTLQTVAQSAFKMQNEVRSKCKTKCVQNAKRKVNLFFGATGTDRLRSVKPAHASAAKQLKSRSAFKMQNEVRSK
jgi:hypothetical protein